MRDERLEKLAAVLVDYATGVKPGDLVAVSGEEAAIPFVKAVCREAVKQGGIVKYFIDFPDLDEYLLKHGSAEQIAAPNFRFGECARADVWISAWGTDNVQTLRNVDGELLKQRRIGNTENRKIYQTRSASRALRWCGTQFPTNGDAQYAGMSLAEYEDFVYRAGFLDREDPVAEWKKQAAFQEKWVQYLDGKKELHILTEGTDLTVGICGRKWINCAGEENFPDGEIFTSPEEDKIDGVITFSFPALINGNEFPRVSLEVEKGRIVSASCQDSALNGRLMSYIDTDAGSRYFGEVAIGTNYGITQFTRNILFDEKMGGTMHMAVGAAMPEAGGVNESAIHWDMINAMQDGGQIYADGELFYENGAFIEDRLLKS